MVVVDRVAENRNTPFELNIYQSEAVTTRNVRFPERSVSRHIIASFEDFNRDIRIVRGFEPVPVLQQQSVCPDPGEPDGIGEWQTNLGSDVAPSVASDSNLLIMDTGGGGCGAIGGNYCTAPGRHITHDPGFVDIGTGDTIGNIHACMHEVAHNMGYVHNPHPGWGNNISGRWHRTPSVGGNDFENRCGEFIPERQHTPVTHHNYYHDCVFQHMKITDKPLLPVNGGNGNGNGNGTGNGEPPGPAPVDPGIGLAAGGLLLALFFLARPEPGETFGE